MPANLPSALVAELRAVSVSAAQGASEVVRSYAGRVLREVNTKSSPTDIVSEADRASEKFIASYIRRHRPDDALHGEEGTLVTGASGISWTADPLDGTTNFYFQVPAYSVSLAARFGDAVVAGAVVDCCRGETWSAGQGLGASCNDEPCAVARGRSRLSTALVSTGFGYQPEQRSVQGAVLAEIIAEFRDVRRFGSAALDLCWVAGGRYDAFYESGLNDWDSAAGALICAEAGGTVATLPCGPLLASTPELFGPLATLLDNAYGRLVDRPRA